MNKNNNLKLIALAILLSLSSCKNVIIKKNYNSPILKKESEFILTPFSKAEKKLLSKADRLVKKEIKSITDKEALPPSGNKHDYYSRAIYYWPDSTSSSKKWKFVDGKVNRKSLEETDHFTFFNAMGAIRDLSLAYHLSGNEKYAQKVFNIIDQWFVNENTKMNPNFNYSQAIPGKNDGSHWGIISSRAIVWVIDGLEMIKQSISFDENIYSGFKSWSTDFLTWLKTSKFGLKEGATKSNHATFYALQVAKLADFTNENEVCLNELKRVKEVLIPEQIKKGGKLPAELKRSTPIKYSLFNLSAFFHLAMLGDKYNMDLWNSKTESGGSISEAFDFILKKLDKVKDTDKMKPLYSNLIGLLTIANKKFDGKYNTGLEQFKKLNYNFRLVDGYFNF